jgi:hypothetical protein
MSHIITITMLYYQRNTSFDNQLKKKKKKPTLNHFNLYEDLMPKQAIPKYREAIPK